MTSTGNARTGEQTTDLRAARRAAIGGSVGNFMVFYELFVYGYLADIIGRVFFPSGNAFTAFIAAFGVYALAYATRPIGAVVLGRIADRRGRRPVLIATLIVMCVATTVIGVLPTYGQVGFWAPVLLVVLRIVQSFAASGEFGGAVALMAEFAPANRRGLYTSWQSFTIGVALVAGSGLATLLTGVLGRSAMLAWGWRVPFLLAAVFGAIALYLRKGLEESPAFLRAQQSRRDAPRGRFQPLRFRVPAWVLVPFIPGALLAWISGGTVMLQVLPSYTIATTSMSNLTAELLTLVGSAVFAITIPVFGWLSDIAGRRSVMLLGALIIAAVSYPLFLVITLGNVPLMFASVAVGGAAVAMLAGPGPALMAELFSASNRVTGLGLGYNIAEAAFDGNAGLIIGGFRSLAGDPVAAAFYPILGGVVSVICLSMLRRTHGTPLREG